MPEQVEKFALLERAAGDDSGKFYADLANGLHAMAQPLTILRAAIEVLNLPPGAAIDPGRYLEISAAQVERTCRLFTNVQDLVTARNIAAVRTGFDLAALIGPLIEDRRILWQASGVAIAVARQQTATPILGDDSRTRQALAAILEIASELAVRGDVIELQISRAGSSVQLAIENTRPHGRRLEASMRLSLALAEANILSQEGTYEFVFDPFRVCLTLPIDELAASGPEPVAKPEGETVAFD